MKRIISAMACFLLLSFEGAAWAQEPQAEEPQVDYAVHFTADFQGMGAIGAVPSDLLILNQNGDVLFSKDLNQFLAGPSFTVTLTDPGPYDWRLKGWQHLATGGVGATSPIDAGTQLVGDTPEVVAYSTPPCPFPPCYRYEHGDNVVESLDFSRLRRWFGAERPCCPPLIMEFDRCDFDGEADVGAADFSLMRPNFGLSGFEFGAGQ